MASFSGKFQDSVGETHASSPTPFSFRAPDQNSVKWPVEPLLAELLGEDIITVTVGAISKKYRLHKNLLCHHSTFFDAAFNGEFKEGKTGELRLPEDRVSAFDMFVNWLYRGSLPPSRVYGVLDGVYGGDDSALDDLSLYAMAEKWFIPTLQDALCDQLRTRYIGGACPLPYFFENLYSETSPSCKLRQYFVKKFVVYASSAQKDPVRVNKTLEQNADFAIDVAKETFSNLILSGFGLFKNPENLPLCDFHAHPMDKPCQSAQSKAASTSAPGQNLFGDFGHAKR
ncbi:MAG: hypothetical protein M1830_002338 [Pleopsidium flavum]|nr:MAG: hypothetical protein M1830_003149 [Pleopsidium flavum]KAI9877970.1 MAG: hypothetical protein M1830_002338 [Pleopsidium flavum]